jgi:L-alanine-DL-glutamate epimerase-like enolase superfamily enzyme
VKSARVERWPIAREFAIARGSKTEAVVVVVEIASGGARGLGEAVPYARYGETPESVLAQIESCSVDRAELARALPRGAARAALDCAFVDLECKLASRAAHDLVGLPPPSDRTSARTVSLGSPDEMEAHARELAELPILKVKLGDERDLARLEAVRRGAPRAELRLDPNESWSEARYREIVPRALELGVALIEQPFRAGEDGPLARLPRPIPVCADEATFGLDDYARLADRYDAVNVKIDKSGGLTQAIEDCARVRGAGMKLMIGCMVSTSLAIAPARLLATGAHFVDLDGADLLARDREYAWGVPW